jgi:alkylation response protein AidB-like acyl-CoA dehydrogenase
MNFDLSEEQELFRATVERFVAPVGTEFRRTLRGNPHGYDRSRWQELAELGLLALAVGEEAGGMGGGPIDLALVAEALGKGNAPDPWLENGVLPACVLAESGQQALLDEVLTGQSVVAAAFAERGMRYSLKAKGMTARTQGDGFVLSGEKTFVMGGALADWLIVTAECGGETALFLIAADAAGLERRPYRLADGSEACELRCLNVAVSADARLALPFAGLLAIIDHIRLLASAEMLGLAQRLFDDTLDYVKQREQFGVALGTFQALQHRLVECYAALEQARSMLYRAALADQSDAAAWHRSCAGAKAFIGEQADRVAREAVQLHGGMGVTDELAIGHAMKRVLLLNRLFGDADSMLAEYAEAA